MARIEVIRSTLSNTPMSAKKNPEDFGAKFPRRERRRGFERDIASKNVGTSRWHQKASSVCFQNAVISIWPALHGLGSISSELIDFVNGVEAKIGDFMLLEIGPGRLPQRREIPAVDFISGRYLQGYLGD